MPAGIDGEDTGLSGEAHKSGEPMISSAAAAPIHSLDPAQAIGDAESVMLRAYAMHLGADAHQAADIAQQALLLYLRQPQRFRSGADLGAWLRGIARKLLLKHNAQSRRLVPALSQFIEQAWSEPGPESAGRQKDALRLCRTRLTAHLSRLIDLRYDQGLTCAEVALKAGLNLSAVKVGLLRAREALAECVRRSLEAGHES